MTVAPRVHVAALAAVIALASLARADAPPTQYEGLFGPSTPTIKDHWTGLTWQRRIVKQGSFLDAASYCGALALAPGGWRVPSYKELLTLVDESPNSEYDTGQYRPKFIDINAFPATPTDHAYWTSSLCPARLGSNQAYVVHFDTGTVSLQDLGTPLYVRCVRQ